MPPDGSYRLNRGESRRWVHHPTQDNHCILDTIHMGVTILIILALTVIMGAMVMADAMATACTTPTLDIMIMVGIAFMAEPITAMRLPKLTPHHSRRSSVSDSLLDAPSNSRRLTTGFADPAQRKMFIVRGAERNSQGTGPRVIYRTTACRT